MADAQDRNLPASERKIRKAREDGQVARSRDLSHLAVIGGGGVALLAATPWLIGGAQHLLEAGLRFNAHDLLSPDAMQQRLGELTWAFLGIVVPMGPWCRPWPWRPAWRRAAGTSAGSHCCQSSTT